MKLFGPESGARLAYGSIGRTAVEAILALTTGLLLARLAWVVAGPGEGFGSASFTQPQLIAGSNDARSGIALLTRTDPFQSIGTETNQIVVPTSLNLKIAGLRWSDGDASSSSAVLILPDNSQKRYSVGEAIISGATLEAVAADRVFLRLNGQLQELRFIDSNKALFSTSPSSASIETAPAQVQNSGKSQAASATSPAVTPALLMTDIDLQPEMRNGAVSGYRLLSRGQGYFEAAGLLSGDLVLRINGNSIEGMSPDAIQRAVMASDTIALDVVRNGAIIRLRLSPESGLSQ